MGQRTETFELPESTHNGSLYRMKIIPDIFKEPRDLGPVAVQRQIRDQRTTIKEARALLTRHSRNELLISMIGAAEDRLSCLLERRNHD